MSNWTPEAQRLWERLPAETQDLILGQKVTRSVPVESLERRA